MADDSVQVERLLGAVKRTPAQDRILTAALALIAEHGIRGTSLQMIADSVGVTKAAVYHKFRTKDEIVIGVTERELARLEDDLIAAERLDDKLKARKMLLERSIELAVARRDIVKVLQYDPDMVRLLGEHPPFAEFMARLLAVLLAEDYGLHARVSAAVFSAAIAGAVVNPLVADVDDDTLRSVLTELTTRMLDLNH